MAFCRCLKEIVRMSFHNLSYVVYFGTGAAYPPPQPVSDANHIYY